MAAYDYKIAFQVKDPAVDWEVSVWRRELRPHNERGPWSCILAMDAYMGDGHVDSLARVRQVLRSLA